MAGIGFVQRWRRLAQEAGRHSLRSTGSRKNGRFNGGIIEIKNRYEIRGDVTAIFLTHKGVELETLIETADLTKVMAHPGNWRALWSPKGKRFMCFGNKYRGNDRQDTIYLHRYIMDAEPGFDVDHRNHRTLDNRRSNLRTVTHAQNQQNRKGAETGSASGIRGVRWREEKRKWQARVKLNDREHHVGYFDSKDEATDAVIFWRAKNMPFSETDVLQAAAMGDEWIPPRPQGMRTSDKNALRFLSGMGRGDFTTKNCADSISQRNHFMVAGCPTTADGWHKRLKRLTALGWIWCSFGKENNLYGFSEAGLAWLKSEPVASPNWQAFPEAKDYAGAVLGQVVARR